ncbi:MAG: radical SAM/SPASM domain-containing protein [Thermodesulfobacteriota bacterium]
MLKPMKYQYQLLLRLLKNSLKFQYLRQTGRAGKPQAVSLEITHNCIAKCVMCNIWKIPASVPDLKTEEWLELLSSPLFSDVRELDITGGEPFLRKDLIDIFSGICKLTVENLKSLKSIAITTNGLLTDTVLSALEDILPILSSHGLDLVVVTALDATDNLHDRIRNFPGALSRVINTIDGLSRMRQKHLNLIVGLKTTILPQNIDQLGEICEFAAKKELFTIISPCIITEGRYLNPDRKKDLVFSKKDIQKMVVFFSGQTFRWSIHAASLVALFKTGSLKKPCSCGFNYFFIRSTGEMFLCPLINESMGNITTSEVSELFHSDLAVSVRKKIGRMPQCKSCTEPGLERYSLPFEGGHYLKIFFRLGWTKFIELHRHMGLDKYL